MNARSASLLSASTWSIAGEDDTDAPPIVAKSQTNRPASKENQNQFSLHQKVGCNFGQRGTKTVPHTFPPTLDLGASAVLRDQLAAELKCLSSPEEVTTWAHRVLAAKGTLQPDDAKQIEEAFRGRTLALEKATAASDPRQSKGKTKRSRSRETEALRSTQQSGHETIDKSSLTHPEPRRIRDHDHLRFVTKQACLICGRNPSDPHHVRFTQHRALGRKVSDEFTVPLCRGHHREVHRAANEMTWWQALGIDPTEAARALWLKTHPLPPTPGPVSDPRAQTNRDRSVGGPAATDKK